MTRRLRSLPALAALLRILRRAAACSVYEQDLAAAIRMGVRKINVGSVIKQRYLVGLREACNAVARDANPYEVIGSGLVNDVLVAGQLAMQHEVERLMRRHGMQQHCGVEMRLDCQVPMRDGVDLSADLYLPKADGPFPTVLIRTPYSNNLDDLITKARRLANEGYACVLQDVRGRWDSEGEFYPFVNEANDGYDTQQWIGLQPFSNGKIGMAGGSYLGAAQRVSHLHRAARDVQRLFSRPDLSRWRVPMDNHTSPHSRQVETMGRGGTSRMLANRGGLTTTRTTGASRPWG